MPRKRPLTSQTNFTDAEFRLSVDNDRESTPEYDPSPLETVPVSQIFSIQAFHILAILYGLFFIYVIICSENYLNVGNIQFLPLLLVHGIFEYGRSAISWKLSNQYRRTEINDFLNYLSLYVLTIATCYVFIVLFGADLLDNIEGTFVFSCTLATLIIVPLCCNAGTKSFMLLCLQEKPVGLLQKCIVNASHSVIVGAWFGAFVIPLDWDRPWQTWPIPCVIGSLAGYTAGQVISFFRLLLRC